MSDYLPGMPLTLDELASEAMHLPAESRAELAERLVESLHRSENEAIQRAWAEEAILRRDEVRSGKVQPIPGEAVLAEARRIVSR